MAIIAIDAMGGDHGFHSTVPGALDALKKYSDLKLILVGNASLIRKKLQQLKAEDHPRLEILNATEVVEMDESPSSALRHKKDSSMRVAINLVKEGRANACVSSGNTGALMATSRFVLKTLPGIDRPAIIYGMPGIDPKTGERALSHMLDLGANVDCTAEHLFQFALMGSIRTTFVDHIQKPRVALLNIGEEEMKGLDVIKAVAQRLAACPEINYIGFIEGNDIFWNKADVIVCDGFVGNISLKTMEGTAKLISFVVKNAFSRSLFSKFLAILAYPVLRQIKSKMDPRYYNGASFLGLKGIVIKSHGGADALAFSMAISVALEEIAQDIPGRIHDQVEQILGLKDEG
ncbi:MAG: phosphate acyltransferase PlsX [Gammaproteobacteria bacterium]|nr:phosphate acyltransferase PlsX [Gammaproteobacteria bacterium]